MATLDTAMLQLQAHYSTAGSVPLIETLKVILSTVIMIADVHKKMPHFSVLYCFSVALELRES